MRGCSGYLLVGGIGQLPGGFITRVVETIQPTVLAQELPQGENPSQYVNEMVRAHTSATASRLLQESRIIADAVARGETIVLVLLLSFGFRRGRYCL